MAESTAYFLLSLPFIFGFITFLYLFIKLCISMIYKYDDSQMYVYVMERLNQLNVHPLLLTFCR
jgi:hypothetical protein